MNNSEFYTLVACISRVSTSWLHRPLFHRHGQLSPPPLPPIGPTPSQTQGTKMLDRELRIKLHRQKQSMEELRRKADKAKNKANLWTQEELDFAHARAVRWHQYFHREHIAS